MMYPKKGCFWHLNVDLWCWVFPQIRVILSRTKCKLIATARHHGVSVNSGHATMCGVRNGQWWHMDGSSVSSIADPDTTSTVIAMYQLQ